MARTNQAHLERARAKLNELHEHLEQEKARVIVGYALDKLVMCVRFRDGSEYEFEGVSQSAYVKLMNAPSIGSHFANEMRGKYKCWRLKKARPQARIS